jgi:hypothetical protein
MRVTTPLQAQSTSSMFCYLPTTHHCPPWQFGGGVSICQSNSCILLISYFTIHCHTIKSLQLSLFIFVLTEYPNGTSVAPVYFCSRSQPQLLFSCVCKLCPCIFVLTHKPNVLSVAPVYYCSQKLPKQSVSCISIFLSH